MPDGPAENRARGTWNGSAALAGPNGEVDYARWNDAFSRVVFVESHAHAPVYLDVEDDVLLAVASLAGFVGTTAGVAEASLVAAVRRRLRLAGGQTSVFAWFTESLAIWRNRRRVRNADLSVPPPVVALLAVFARAADRMGADSKFNSTAYYPRLDALLSLDRPDGQRVRSAFTAKSETYWDALNLWLEDLDGSRGIPTAYTVGLRYVGIPMSQALIRDADRARLVDFYADMGLEAGLELPADDLVPYFAQWMLSGRAPIGMMRLWQAKEGQVLLAAAASQGLQHWDGGGRPADSTARGSRPDTGQLCQPRAVTTGASCEGPVWTVQGFGAARSGRAVPAAARRQGPGDRARHLGRAGSTCAVVAGATDALPCRPTSRPQSGSEPDVVRSRSERSFSGTLRDGGQRDAQRARRGQRLAPVRK